MSATAVAGAPPVGSPPVRPPSRERLDSVDLLRGVVMVIMALDHVRDFFTAARFEPTDLSQTTAALFATRWVTHFCAPVFVLLAGTGTFLMQSRGRSRGETAWFLVTRGFWLIVLELTVVRWAWMFNFDYVNELLFIQVIWALGASMIVLAGLIYLPLPAVAGIGLAMIAGHNLLDGYMPAAGAAATLWTLLHVQAPIPLGGGRVLMNVYPLVPWIGVMAAGYALGPLLLRPAAERRRVLLRLGAALMVGFVVLRALNVYGDPEPWSAQRTGLFTLLSFLDTTKYPPSLLFLLMTLGPSLVALALFERVSGPVARFFIVYGRVPLFYYVLHLYLIHALALAVATLAGFRPEQFLTVWLNLPDGWGYGLPVIYAVWIGVVLSLYPVCRWFAGVKARRREAWLSYL